MDWTEWETESKTQDQNIKPIEIITQCYHVAENAERIHRVKSQESQRLLIGKWCFCRSAPFATAKSQDLSKNKRLADCWVD